MLIKDSVWLQLFIPGVTFMWAKFQITKDFRSLHKTLLSTQETRKKIKNKALLLKLSMWLIMWTMNGKYYVQHVNSQF